MALGVVSAALDEEPLGVADEEETMSSQQVEWVFVEVSRTKRGRAVAIRASMVVPLENTSHTDLLARNIVICDA